MVLSAAVLTLLLRQPPCWEDRAYPAVKAAQLQVIADAIAAASPTIERAAELATTGYHESRWCLAVGAGIKRGGQGEGYWQLEGTHHGEGARSGLVPAASAQLDNSRQCGKGPAAVFTAYAGRPCWQAIEWWMPPGDARSCTIGQDCVRREGWPTLDARVRGYWWAVSVLRQAHAG